MSQRLKEDREQGPGNQSPQPHLLLNHPLGFLLEEEKNNPGFLNTFSSLSSFCPRRAGGIDTRERKPQAGIPGLLNQLLLTCPVAALKERST